MVGPQVKPRTWRTCAIDGISPEGKHEGMSDEGRTDEAAHAAVAGVTDAVLTNGLGATVIPDGRPRRPGSTSRRTATRSRDRHPGLPRGPAAPGADQVAAHRPGHEGAAGRPLARASWAAEGWSGCTRAGASRSSPQTSRCPPWPSTTSVGPAKPVLPHTSSRRSTSRPGLPPGPPTSARCASSTRWTRSPR